jgi:hypothetical protein
MKIIDFAIRGVPVLTPVPTAFVVASTVIEILTKRSWEFWVAIIPAVAVALAIEGLGFGTMDVALRMRDYNQSRRQRYDLAKKQVIYRDPHAPVEWAYGVAAIYIVIAILFTVLTDIIPEMQKYVFGVLPFLSALGAMLYALRQDHDRRVGELLKSKADEKAEREKKKNESAKVSGKAQKVSEKAPKVSEKAPKVSEDKDEKPETFGKWKTWRQLPESEKVKIMDFLKANSKRMAMEEVVKTYGTSERVAYGWLEYAERDLGANAK